MVPDIDKIITSSLNHFIQVYQKLNFSSFKTFFESNHKLIKLFQEKDQYKNIFHHKRSDSNNFHDYYFDNVVV